MSIVAIGVSSVFRRAIQIWERVEMEMKLQQEARAVLNLMGKEFLNAASIPGVKWSNSDGEITFATVRNDSIMKITYEFQSSAISRREIPLSPERIPNETSSTMTSFPAQLQWQYAYISNTPDVPIRWESEWKNPTVLPSGIRIQLTLQDPDGVPHSFSRTLFSPVQDLPLWLN